MNEDQKLEATNKIIDRMVNAKLDSWKDELAHLIANKVREINTSWGFDSRKAVNYILENCVMVDESVEVNIRARMLKELFDELKKRGDIYNHVQNVLSDY